VRVAKGNYLGCREASLVGGRHMEKRHFKKKENSYWGAKAGGGGMETERPRKKKNIEKGKGKKDLGPKPGMEWSRNGATRKKKKDSRSTGSYKKGGEGPVKKMREPRPCMLSVHL